MKNFVKILGIIALIAVIGFGMTACSDSGGGGGGGISSVDWVGTWEQGTVVTIVLNSDDSWDINSSSTGSKWEVVANHNSKGPALLLTGGTDNFTLYFEVFSSTQIYIHDAPYMIWEGTYTKR